MGYSILRLPTILILFTAFTLFVKATDKPFLITEIRLFDNDSTFKYVYLYNSYNQRVIETQYFLKDNVWKNLLQTEWYYSDSTEIGQAERKWNGNQWIDYYNITIERKNNIRVENHYVPTINTANLQKTIEREYDNDTLKSERTYVIVGNTRQLTDSISHTYTKKQLTETIHKNFRNAKITAAFKYIYSYYTDSKLATLTLLQQSNDSLWENINKTSWFYKPGTSLISSQRTKKWNKVINNWENSQMLAYVYNADNQTEEEISYYWREMLWEKTIRYSYEYDSNGELSKKFFSKPIYNQWRNISTIQYGTLTSENKLDIESVYGFWGGNKGELVSAYIPFDFNNEAVIEKGKHIQLVYSEVNNSKNLIDNNKLAGKINVYPNPSNGVFYYNTNDYQVQSWAIYDLNGCVVLNSKPLKLSGAIDLSLLPSGIYFLKAISENEILIQKLIKQ